MTDPFCNEASGARWTDAVGQVATLTYQSRVLVTLGGDASGWAALTFVPEFFMLNGSGNFYIVNAITGNTITVAMPDSGDSVLAGISSAANSSGGRIVSAGMRWWDVAPSTSTGGVVIATEWTDYQSYFNAVGTLNGGSVNMGSASEVYDRREEGAWVSRPSSPMAYTFNAPTDTPKWARTACTISTSGAATTNILAVEMVLNVEVQVAAESAFTRLVRPNPVNRSSILAAKVAGEVESQITPFVHGGKQAVKRYIHNAAARAIGYTVRAGASALGAYFGGPRGALAGYQASGTIMDVD
jgi:hypothetical protein